MRSIYADYVSLFTGQLKTASNARTIAEARRDRIKGLADKGIVAVSELEQAENAAVIAKQVEERVKRGREFMQKNIETFDLQIKQSNFYSEIDGVVTDLIVDPKSLSGNLIVMPGAMVVKVDRPGIYRAEAQLLDTQVHGIKAGMKASVTLPDGSQFSGKVVFVSLLPMVPNLAQDPYASPSPDKMSAAVIYYKAIIDFERTGAILPPGLLAEVSIVKDEYKAKACLPWNAIEVSEGKAFIRVFEDGKGWQQIPITVGRRGRYYAEVMTPIAANAIIKSKIW
ncbi:MAG: HlyD family efflux transporter periplasmic adaptor subunit [Pseudomonadota bacterium]